MIALLLVSVNAQAADPTAPPPIPDLLPPSPPRVETSRLRGSGVPGAGAEGLPVWFVERHSVPLVHVALAFERRPEESTASSTASLGPIDALQSLWPLAFQRMWGGAVADLGADVRFDCDDSRCSWTLDAPAERAEAALDRVAHVSAPPVVRATDLARWRASTRKKERDQSWDRWFVHDLTVRRLLRPLETSARSDATPGSVRLGLDSVRRAWRSLVSEAPAVVVVVGDTSLPAILPSLERAFGGLRAAPPQPAVRLPVPPMDERHLLVDLPGSGDRAIVSVVGHGPPGEGYAGGSPEQRAFALAFHVFAEGFASRLNLRLREQDGLVYGVEADFEPGRSEARIDLWVAASQVGDVIRGVQQELGGLGRDGITPLEYASALHGAWASVAAQCETSAGLSRQLIDEWMHGRAATDTFRTLYEYQNVSLAAVNAAAAAWATSAQGWVVSGDADRMEMQLQAVDFIVTRIDRCEVVGVAACR